MSGTARNNVCSMEEGMVCGKIYSVALHDCLGRGEQLLANVAFSYLSCTHIYSL